MSKCVSRQVSMSSICDFPVLALCSPARGQIYPFEPLCLLCIPDKDSLWVSLLVNGWRGFSMKILNEKPTLSFHARPFGEDRAVAGPFPFLKVISSLGKIWQPFHLSGLAYFRSRLIV